MLMPYIRFKGQCEEAFRWYVEVFGGELQHISKFSDVPDNFPDPVDEGYQDKVMHAMIVLDGHGCISGSDARWEIVEDSRICLQVHLEDADKMKAVFEKLSERGTVQAALIPNPPPDDGSVSGMLTDPYGVCWIISGPNEQ